MTPQRSIPKQPHSDLVQPKLDYLANQSITENFFSAPIDASIFTHGSFSIDWDSFSATNSKAILQVTNDPDGGSWSQWGGEQGSRLLDTVEGSQNWEIWRFTHRFFRLAVYAGNVVSGNLNARYELRR